ncbi:MAG: RHS repeat-associated core domain-containing protein [Chloroflexota bacterium]
MKFFNRSTLGLLLVFLFISSPSQAQTYYWETSPQLISGCQGAGPGYSCQTAQLVCDGIKAYYASPYGDLVMSSRVDVFGDSHPMWVCKYFYLTLPRSLSIRSGCPSGLDENAWSTSGCTVSAGRKTFGAACPDPALGEGVSGDAPWVSKPQCGNPITVSTGNKFETKIDIQGSGAHPLIFARTYNSQIRLTNGVMGPGWRNIYERFLENSGSTKWGAWRGDGQRAIFNKSGGVWSSDTDVVLKLVQSGSNWLLTDGDKTVETYNSTGVLQSIAFLDGYTQTLTYTSGKLTTVADNLGRSLTLTYNGDGLVDTVTDPNGEVYTYAYVNAYPSTTALTKILSTVTYPDSTPSPTDNPVITYLYEDTNFPTYLTGITDELGNRYATWAYDSTTGRATSSQHAGGAGLTTITYNVDGTRTVTGPLGGQDKYTFSTLQSMPKVTRIDRLAVGSIPAANSLFTYNANGFAANYTDWKGNVTKHTISSAGLETSRTEAFGGAQARTIGTTWDTTLRLPTQVTRTGLTVDMTYDAAGNMLTYKQTDSQTQTVPYTTTGNNRTWTNTYDALGNVLTADGPRTDLTDTTTYTYTSTEKNLATVTNALSQVTSITSYDNMGRPLSFTDPNSLVTDLTYDDLGRLKTYTVNATAGNQVTTIDYDLAGLVTLITLPDATTLTYTYDNAQRLTAVENEAGERIEYTLDADGNIIQEDVKNATPALRAKQAREFDEISRLKKNIGASSPQATAYLYDANSNRTRATDARSNATNMAFDALDRLITITDPLTKVASTGYDSRDNATSQSDFRTLSTTYVYDGFNRVIQATSPDTGTTVYNYDLAENVTSQTDARGVVTNRTFDALNRPLTVTFPAYSGENMAFTYDSTASGNKGVGRLTGITDESGTTALTYDDVGNVTQSVRTIGAQSYTTAYAYDVANRVTQVTYPSGRTVTYTYDSHGKIITVVTSTGTPATLASSITYEPFGPLKGLTYGNSLTLARTFDQNYWLTDIVTEDGAMHVQDLDIAYDNAGNITAITDNLASGRNQTFTLDTLNRLSQAVGAYGTVDYTYDFNSNRLTRVKGGVTQTSTLPGGSNKLTSINDGTNTRSFTYTASGNTATDNRATDPDVTFTYGGRNRLESVLVGAVTTTYKVNAFGERVSKSDGTTTTHFHYDEDGRLIAESDASGVNVREYIWLGNMPLAQVEAAGTVYYVHTDHLNTPQKMTDAAQAVVWDRQQEAFGETYATSGAAASNLRFPGQFADAESSLHYNYMRDYDPTLGRYVQADTIGLGGGMNIYGYGLQNPIFFYDSRGEFALPLFVGGVVLLVGILDPDVSHMFKTAGMLAGGGATFKLARSAWLLSRQPSSLAKPAANQNTCSQIQFGGNPNAVSHAFRHVKKAGLDVEAVESSVRMDLNVNASKIVSGFPLNRMITVNGTNITYTAFRLPNGVINVGRITVP